MSVIVNKMDGQLDGLESFFKSYKERLEAAASTNANRAEVLMKSARRRRIMKRNMEEKLARTMRDIVSRLEASSGNVSDPTADPDYKLYDALRKTFNAYDRDGNAELGWPEYQEAWNFLELGGTPNEIKKAFDAVE